MDELNTARTRSTVLFGSVLVVLLVTVGFFALYQMQDDFNQPKQVQSDPTKKIGTGDGQSKNPATIDAIDKPAEKSP
jgi:hypothetical protein